MDMTRLLADRQIDASSPGGAAESGGNHREMSGPRFAPRRLWLVLAVVFITGWFFWFAGAGIFADFSEDDVMNLYHYWRMPPERLLLGCLWLPPTVYRPLGGLFYRGMYELFGLNPFPYRAVCFGLLLLNLGLFYSLGRLLTGRRDLALLAVFLASYHAWFVDLYRNTATVYELLCVAGYLCALNRYLKVRQGGGRLGWRDWAVVTAAYVAALDAKELAVTFPVAILLYEGLFHPPAGLSRLELGRFLGVTARPAWVLATLTVPYVAAKLSGGLLAGDPAYRPRLSAQVYVDTFHLYLNPFFYQEHFFQDSNTGYLVGILLVLALLLKRKDLLWAWAFTLVSVLPFIFIPHYCAFFWYLPMTGWAILAAGLLLAARDSVQTVLGRLCNRLSEESRSIRPMLTAALMCPLVVFLAWAHSRESVVTLAHFQSAQAPVRPLVEALRRHLLQPRDGARIVLLDDPYRPGWDSPRQIAQLTFDHPSLSVTRLRSGDHPDAAGSDADLVLVYSGGAFHRMSHTVPPDTPAK